MYLFPSPISGSCPFSGNWSPCPILPPLGPLTRSTCCPRYPPRCKSSSDPSLTSPSQMDGAGFLAQAGKTPSICFAPGKGPWCLGQSPCPDLTSTWHLPAAPVCFPHTGTCHQSEVAPGLLLSFSGPVKNRPTLVGQQGPPLRPLCIFLLLWSRNQNQPRERLAQRGYHCRHCRCFLGASLDTLPMGKSYADTCFTFRLHSPKPLLICTRKSKVWWDFTMLLGWLDVFNQSYVKTIIKSFK